MKLGKALSTGYAQDAYDDTHEHDTDLAPAEGTERVPEPVKAAAEAAERPRQAVGAAAR